MRLMRALCLLPLVALFPSCATDKGKTTDKDNTVPAGGSSGNSPLGTADLSEYRRMRDEANQGTPIKSGGNVGDVPLGGNLRPEDLVWTDADSADADIKLDELLEDAKKHRGPWEASEAIAIRESKMDGKPLLIWFTDTNTPNVDKPITMELFNRSDFEKWATENLIRLRVDQSPKGSTISETDARKIYVRKLKERYKVMGYPTLLVVTPTGDVISRIKGFTKGQGDYKWGLIKQGVGLAKENYSRTRADLTKKGYRDWTDTKGRTVFAKLSGYRDGELVLTEPDGQRARTNERRLSEGDRDWIRQEKEKRGIQ